MKNKLILLVLLVTILMSNYIVFAEETLKTANDFNDISKTHWGLEYINWGLSKGIIGGFGNGRFSPNGSLTEEQFAAILAKFCTNLSGNYDEIEGKPWSDPYYNEILEYSLPFRGYENSTIRNGAINRGHVAMIIAAKYGFNLTEKQAIYFMYENGLSNGKSFPERTYETYGARDLMTRTELLAFLKTMSNLNDRVMTFKGNPSIMGYADAQTMLGVRSVYVNNKIEVDFAEFNKDIPEPTMLKDLDKITTITTKVVDGKVVAVQGLKITTPTLIEGVKKPSLNYYTIESGRYATVIAPRLNNSIINYKGLDFPSSFWFSTSEGMLKYDDKVVGIVQISLDETYSRSAGSFIDQVSFLSLMNNLKLLGATQSQLDKAIPIIKEWQDKNNREQRFTELVSKSKGTSLLLYYGSGGVTVSLYQKALSNMSVVRTYVD